MPDISQAVPQAVPQAADSVALAPTALLNGARLLRVHDVAEATQTIQLVFNTYSTPSFP